MALSLFQAKQILDQVKWPRQSNLRSLVCGRWFSEILFASDRKGVTTKNFQFECFHDWVSDIALIDLHLTNIKHTRSNFRVNTSCSKIDRVFVSKDWLELHPENHLKGPPRPVSDHSPLLAGTDSLTGGPTPFRLENMWLKHPSFKQSIQSRWTDAQTNRWVAQRFQQKSKSSNPNWRAGIKMFLEAYSSKTKLYLHKLWIWAPRNQIMVLGKTKYKRSRKKLAGDKNKG